MRLTDVVSIWDEMPANIDESDCTEEDLRNTFCFEDFVNAVHKIVGVVNDIPALGGEKEQA